jgi:hypothetical protein
VDEAAAARGHVFIPIERTSSPSPAFDRAHGSGQALRNGFARYGETDAATSRPTNATGFGFCPGGGLTNAYSWDWKSGAPTRGNQEYHDVQSDLSCLRKVVEDGPDAALETAVVYVTGSLGDETLAMLSPGRNPARRRIFKTS